MTEEEKTEEYLKCEFACGDYDRENKKCIFKNKCEKYKIYLDGLAEGRKENILKECANDCKIPEGCDVLVRYELLEKENAELSNSVIELTNAKTELENKVTELEKQNEKMKNCHNCKHSFHNGGYEEKCSGCWKYESKKDFQTNKKTYLHWELAE